MEQVMIEQLIAQSVFAGLFVWLFWDTRKDGKEREARYQEREEKYQKIIHDCNIREQGYQDIIKDCSDREKKYQDTIKELSYVLHDAIKEVQNDVEEIKNKLGKKE